MGDVWRYWTGFRLNRTWSDLNCRNSKFIPEAQTMVEIATPGAGQQGELLWVLAPRERKLGVGDARNVPMCPDNLMRTYRE